ncbi:helix-turn-helix domain-containing protein [Bordetella genomosp. 7]|nr:helix-turn-helix domain-containing protein [Bordetella genomosp. 7]
MRETLDCAVLMTPGHEAWVRDWVASHQGQGRLRLYAQELSALAPGLPDTRLLARARLALRRYDGCVIPVAPTSLSWVRTILANAGAEPRTPLVAMVFDITAPAILDLLALGAADFMRAPACTDELRARLSRLCRGGPSMTPQMAPGGAAGAPPCTVREPVPGYGARASARRTATRARLEAALAALHAQDATLAEEPFRQAKSRVVAGFEREYLRRALSRHGGNVAQAARASSKHRRAFWALMRKHRIDASPYREPR